MLESRDFEKIFYLYCLENPKYLKSIHKGFFESKELDALSYITKKFYDRFNETPSKENLKIIASEKYPDLLTESIIDLVFSKKTSDHDEKWLNDTSEAWILWKNLDSSIVDTIEYVKTTSVTPDNVHEIIHKVKDIITSRNSISFDNDLGLDFFNPESHTQNIQDLIPSGHDFVDQFTGGGYRKKSLIVYAGEQNIGKCQVYNTKIKIRNVKSNKIEDISIGDFFTKIKTKNV